MSHTSIASTRDYNPGHDKGDLANPAQSASFTSDPMLTPISTSSMPKPMLPDPTPSDNPELFDKSTNHPNTHYHPDAKLSKKKRAKKLGLGYVAAPHGATGVHAGGRTFSEHEKEAHERAERRDEAIGAAGEDHDDDEYETDEDNEAHELQQSQTQNHEGRITGTEGSGRSQPASKHNEDVADSVKKQDDDKEGDNTGADEQSSKDKSDNPSLMQRASNVLSSAQQKATGMASGVASSAMSTAQSVPVVGSLLSKLGLGASKSDDSAGGKQEGEQGQEGEEADEQQEGEAGSAKADNSKEGSKVGGNREAETEGLTKGAGKQSTTEAATKKGGSEPYGKEGARQDNNEGALDKSRSHAGQKAADNMKAVNKQAKKEEEA